MTVAYIAMKTDTKRGAALVQLTYDPVVEPWKVHAGYYSDMIAVSCAGVLLK